MNKNYFLFLIFIAFTVVGLNAQSDVKVKNIILLIGDGMGTTQIFAGYTANNGKLNLERSEYVGFSKTQSANRYITDSGAGGTALATGKKTNNEFIAVDPDTIPLKTILESAEQKGLATGLVATCAITHATPASFVAHEVSRLSYENIAADFIGSGVDIFIGGGKNYFEDRSDELNLSDSLRNEGYEIVYELSDINPDNSVNVGCFVAEGHPPSISDGRGDFLPEATEITLKKLSNSEQGFFVMIEGSQIDWGGHERDIDYVITEVIDFDIAVGEAFDFADTHPGTLVIVTADHETGGLSIVQGDMETGEMKEHFSSKDHTGVMVPVFSYGPGAENFAGIYENTEIYHKMMKLLQLE